jgi:pseudouridine-5'-phosphate glycosidase
MVSRKQYLKRSKRRLCMKKYLDVCDSVAKALEKKEAIVALESTIISHGMPYPQNVQTAIEVQNIIKKAGATPATIAIMDGKLKVGLTDEEIERLGKEKNVAKVSRRDIPFVLASGKVGATTVSATMIVAALAGIPIFATGGIGGVHRGAQTTMDISADLDELSKTNVAVICAGAKSILDIKLTLEYLETKGVPVVGIGEKEFPAFFTRKSGFEVNYKIEDLSYLAKALKTKWDLGLEGGVVVANPIPKEHAMDDNEITSAIEKALQAAEITSISGKDVTPFLLSKVKEATGGQSLDANIKLVYNNAKIAAELAIEYAKLS